MFAMRDTNSTDQELISSISKGDEFAFGIFYTRHWSEMYKFAFFILKDKDSCKDLLQDVFVWVWEHKQGLVIQSPKSYLKTAVKYKIANYIRSGKIRDVFFEEVAKVDFASIIPGVNELAELKELNAIIQLTITHLPIKCREIFRLSRECNLSNKEIAEQLGISIKTVENQITIALHRIRTNAAPHLMCVLLFPVIYYN